MKITIKHSLLISLLLHIIIGIFLLLVSSIFHSLNINTVKPVTISISLSPTIQEGEHNELLTVSALPQKPNIAATVTGTVVKKDIQSKVNAKEQFKLKQKKILAVPKSEQKSAQKIIKPILKTVTKPKLHITHSAAIAEYQKAIKAIDALPPSQIPIPHNKIIPDKQAKKTTNLAYAIVSNKKENTVSNQELGVKYARLIGNCIKNKMNLIAIGKPNEFSILVHFYLGKDRKLQGEPSITIKGGDPRQKAIAENQTIFALKACSPFDLPPDKYEIWKEVIMNFSPNQN